MYHMAAKLAATVAKIEIAWPHQISAMTTSQFCGRGLPNVFVLGKGCEAEVFDLSDFITVSFCKVALVL